jgi:polyhydroxyalkanoate synthesis regulator phasin
MTRRRAEELVQELVQSGHLDGGDARAKVDELIERSRKGSEALMGQIRTEVSRQLDSVGITSLEDLATQVAALLGRSAEAARSAGAKRATAKEAATKKAAPKKAAPKKASANKSAAKKAPAKKSAAKKTAPKKAAAKKAPATKVTAPRTGSAG